MLVCIVTLHRARNCGAYLQARALGEKISQLGHEVVYLRPDKTRLKHYSRQRIRSLLAPVRRMSLTGLRLNLRCNSIFDRDRRIFREIRETQSADRYVLGSDVIWQMRGRADREHAQYFFGLAFPGEKVFSYAPSANASPLEAFLGDERISGALARMRDISVRDESTRSIVSALTTRPVSMVCDPVMLHEPSFYRSIQRPCKHSDFILIYAFGMDDFSEARIAQIRAFAQKQGKKLISFGIARRWCDTCLPYDALSMPAYFDEAAFVLTNTFHGTLFSMLYAKQFAVLTDKKAKVSNLLNQFGLTQRILAEDGSVEEILTLPLDREELNRRIEEVRAASVEYLKRNLQ